MRLKRTAYVPKHLRVDSPQTPCGFVARKAGGATAAALLAISLGPAAALAAPASGSGGDDAALTGWQQLAGSSRYETMRAIVRQGFESSDWAVIATGHNYPDALAASALAGTKKAPIILTDGRKATLGAAAKAEVERLGVRSVFIVGSEGSVSAGIEKQLRDMGIAVTRIAGSDRTATSVEVMRQTRAANRSADTVIISSGKGFADALSIGPYSYKAHAPIVLANAKGMLSGETVEAIKADKGIENVVIVGGVGSVSNKVKTQLGKGYSYTRLGGHDRYETSAIIAKWSLEENQGMTVAYPVVATGLNFPDALAGAPLAGSLNSIIVLADGSTAPGISTLFRYRDARAEGYMLGSEKSVSESLAKDISARTKQSADAEQGKASKDNAGQYAQI